MLARAARIVIASTRGGLPEAVGPGGILLDPDQPIADWAAAVRKLWQDQAHYAELSAAAVAYAERREMTFAYQIEAWEQSMLIAAGYTTPATGRLPAASAARAYCAAATAKQPRGAGSAVEGTGTTPRCCRGCGLRQGPDRGLIALLPPLYFVT
jgi:hypothetical protein